MTATAICGSDLHLYDGHVPTMEEGDVLGHDPVGEVVGVGNAVRNPEVVVPFTVSCGSWWFRDEDMYSPCDDSIPDAEMGHSPAGLFGYPHVLGAGRVIAIDRVPERLDMARKHGDAEITDFEDENVYDRPMGMTRDPGPDSCIDTVGSGAHGMGVSGVADKAKRQVGL